MTVSKQVTINLNDVVLMAKFILNPDEKYREEKVKDIAQAIEDADQVIFDCTSGGSKRATLFDPICLSN